MEMSTYFFFFFFFFFSITDNRLFEFRWIFQLTRKSLWGLCQGQNCNGKLLVRKIDTEKL